MRTVIVIPALKPDHRLLALAGQLRRRSDSPVVIVDDGSGEEYRELFDLLEYECRCLVVRHPVNRGKGAALKTGISLALEQYPELSGIVTADADGQHLPEDILRVVNNLDRCPDSLILGTRNLTGEEVPFKSRWGNRITSLVFRLSAGVSCPDTQTGLRGIPARLAEFCLSVPGERYEYEMNMLLAAAREKIPLVLLPVSTVYLEDNRASHFRAVRDSALIYGPILKQSLRFGASSLLCAATDLTAFALLTGSGLFGAAPAGILGATVSARCLSGALNFSLNKRWSFESRGNVTRQAAGYAALFCVQMLLSWAMVSLLSALPVKLLLLKLFTDACLFVGSYSVQKHIIFKPGRAEAGYGAHGV